MKDFQCRPSRVVKAVAGADIKPVCGEVGSVAVMTLADARSVVEFICKSRKTRKRFNLLGTSYVLSGIKIVTSLADRFAISTLISAW
jgi:hypothetical protein